MPYIKQLDALRGVAITSVLIDHWFPEDSLLYSTADKINAPNIFFTISGFLITKILLSDKQKAEHYNYNKSLVIKNFFLKRVLRIFPAYYFLLLLVYLLKAFPVYGWKYYLTFTSNFYIYHLKNWGPITHLWSLSLEEQFYFFWPWIMVFLNKKYLLAAILCFISTGILSQWIFPQDDFSNLLTFSCFDVLGCGALLAWIVQYKSELLSRAYRVLTFLAPICFILIAINFYIIKSYHFPTRLCTALIITWLISHFIITNQRKTRNQQSGFPGRMISIMGKRCYGIYLYHYILPPLTAPALLVLNNHLFLPDFFVKTPYLAIFENLLLLLLISWLSWKYLETPIQNLKKYVRIVPAKPSQNNEPVLA